jgi:hypothetical protein
MRNENNIAGNAGRDAPDERVDRLQPRARDEGGEAVAVRHFFRLFADVAVLPFFFVVVFFVLEDLISPSAAVPHLRL